MTLPDKLTVNQLYHNYDVELRAMADKHNQDKSNGKGTMSRRKMQISAISYKYFKKAQQVSDIYQENGRPLNPVAIERVSSLWKSYSPKEKKIFGPKAEGKTLDNITDEFNNYGVNPGEIPDNCPTMQALVTLLGGSNDEFIHKIGLQTSSCNLEHSGAKCKDFVSGFINQICFFPLLPSSHA
ncbi:hypothetical protein DFH28DRAFT_933626 [Melampsora americana]|nr:hypothetical protein DFH28DRAFT_933626 [Melampsora americana]